MSQLGSRAPGMVGAALADPAVVCGLIADGHHVHATAMRAAINAKSAGAMSLISDAMPPAAGGAAVFTLQGRRIRRDGGRLLDDDDTLAGSMITLLDAVRHVVRGARPAARRRAAHGDLDPARLIGLEQRIGALAPGLRADLVHVDDDLAVRGVWLAGVAQER